MFIIFNWVFSWCSAEYSQIQWVLHWNSKLLSLTPVWRGSECWRREREIYSLGHLQASGSQEGKIEATDQNKGYTFYFICDLIVSSRSFKKHEDDGAIYQNCHFWKQKQELKRTEKNLKELKLSKYSGLRNIKKLKRTNKNWKELYKFLVLIASL